MFFLHFFLSYYSSYRYISFVVLFVSTFAVYDRTRTLYIKQNESHRRCARVIDDVLGKRVLLSLRANRRGRIWHLPMRSNIHADVQDRHNRDERSHRTDSGDIVRSDFVLLSSQAAYSQQRGDDAQLRVSSIRGSYSRVSDGSPSRNGVRMRKNLVKKIRMIRMISA